VIDRDLKQRVANVTSWSSPASGAFAGGDWCEAVAVSLQTVILTIGDVSGHGVDVAEPMAAMRSAVLRTIRDIQVPSEVLSFLNDIAFAWGDGVFVTAIVAAVDYRFGTLTFANAGHPPPLMVTDAGHAFLQQPPADLPLGVFPQHHAADYVIALPTNGLLTLYTDGVTEHACDPVYGEAELVDAVRFVYDRPFLDATHTIASRLFATARGNDDAAMLALRLTTAGER
jgi:serine phosphatase RsbU (regulator of sigma subunit)